MNDVQDLRWTQMRGSWGPIAHQCIHNEFWTCMKLLTGGEWVAGIVINLEYTLDHDAFIIP